MTYEKKLVIPHELAINAMREAGYRNTTYAIAELIDNAIQANAKNIELLCYDRIDPATGRKSIYQIAVADDGDGMTHDILEKSVQFGNGTRLKDRQGIGRFGMGLPNSSISQCKFAEVYTWQNGETPLYSYVSVTKKNTDGQYVPKPERKEIGNHWKQVSNCIKKPSGTLVVWSDLDKCNWRKSSTVIKKSELLIGRIYRNLINRGDIVIRVVSFNENSITPELDYAVPVNDPCFLMAPSSTPKPYDSKPMFEQDGDVETVKISVGSGDYEIQIKYAIAKLEARQDSKGNESGRKEWGKRAARNIGVSLMRADRELELDTGLVNMHDTRERWWGVEIAFDPHLDEIFGVTNTKQSATHFARLAKASRSIKLTGDDIDEDEFSDNDKILWGVITSIESRLNSIREQIKHQLENTRKKRRTRNTGSDAEVRGTDATNERKEEGHDGESDKGEDEPPEQRKESLVKILVEDGSMSNEDANEVARYTVDSKLKYIITSTTLSGKMLFDVLSRNGVLIVKINRNHHAYENLMAVVKYSPSEDDNGELQERLKRASTGIELMLLAWARLEDEQRNVEKRQDMQELRMQWGGMLSKFLKMNT